MHILFLEIGKKQKMINDTHIVLHKSRHLSKHQNVLPSSSDLFSPACLADEEMKLDEEKIDELTKKEEYERIKAQLKAKRVEEERKIAEEKRCLLLIKI